MGQDKECNKMSQELLRQEQTDEPLNTEGKLRDTGATEGGRKGGPEAGMFGATE